MCISLKVPIQDTVPIQSELIQKLLMAFILRHTEIIWLDLCLFQDHIQVNYLWVHIILAFLLFPLAIFLMRRFSIGQRQMSTFASTYIYSVISVVDPN
jgi:hypothetical protein